MTTLHIKNMVCPRCETAVHNLMERNGLHVAAVRLGEVRVEETLTEALTEQLRRELGEMGFELLEDARQIQVERIRTAIIDWTQLNGERPNLSDYLRRHIPGDYGQTSRLFSETRGMTVEHYAILQRIERVKDLLCQPEKNIAEVAWETGYSSPAHLSAQFRQITGLTPRQYKEDRQNQPDARCYIDEI